MLKLYGFSVSNYYNVIKAALLEKGVPFEEVEVYTDSVDSEYLARSPMGKVPCLETAEGAFSETQVMLDYLEEAYPQPALYPTDAFGRAKARELMRIIELYLELPARRLYPQAFFGGKVSDEVKSEVQPALAKGVAALQRMARFEPFIGGSQFGYADLAAAIHLPLIGRASKAVYGEDVLAAIPGLKEYLGMIQARPAMQKVLADYKAGLAAFAARRAG